MNYFKENVELNSIKLHLKEIEKTNIFNIREDLKVLYESFNDIICESNTYNENFIENESYFKYRTLKNQYKKICKETGIKTILSSKHCMSSNKASEVNIGGHYIEKRFQDEFGFDLVGGVKKEDLSKNDILYTLKSGLIIQWALKKVHLIDESLKDLLNEWVYIFEASDYLSNKDRNIIINNLINELKDKNVLSKLISYFISNFNVDRLIIKKNDNDNEYYNFSEYNISDFVNLVTENAIVDRTLQKGSIIFKIPINGKEYTCFSLEYRTDKSAIFFRSDRRNIIKLLCEYNIDILNKYQLKK